jgi:hypothetical protein
MEYTAKQIEIAKREYNAMMWLKSLSNYEVSLIGIDEATERMDAHNAVVLAIRNGNKEIERTWKLFFLNEAVKSTQKAEESQAKIKANKEASSDVLAPVKNLKKLGEFGKWLNTPKNAFRKEHFSKKYTQNSVNAFLQTL